MEGKGTPVPRPKYWAIGWKSLGGGGGVSSCPLIIESTKKKKKWHVPYLGEFNGEVAQQDELRAVPLFSGGGDFILQDGVS